MKRLLSLVFCFTLLGSVLANGLTSIEKEVTVALDNSFDVVMKAPTQVLEITILNTVEVGYVTFEVKLEHRAKYNRLLFKESYGKQIDVLYFAWYDLSIPQDESITITALTRKGYRWELNPQHSNKRYRQTAFGYLRSENLRV